jgi:hypothetical protein
MANIYGKFSNKDPIIIFLLSITFKEQDAPIRTAKIENPLHVNAKSLILLLYMCNTNIGFQPKRISLFKSISSTVQRAEPTTGAKQTRGQNRMIEKKPIQVPQQIRKRAMTLPQARESKRVNDLPSQPEKPDPNATQSWTTRSQPALLTLQRKSI